MVKTNLTIDDFEDKKYGAGQRYTRFNTSKGWISSFDKPTIEKLKDSEGKNVSVEIVTDKNDKQKITKYYGPATESNEVSNGINDLPDPKLMHTKKVDKTNIGTDRNVTFNTSYAKDIFIALAEIRKGNIDIEECMNEAINLVKQARKAFE